MPTSFACRLAGALLGDFRAAKGGIQRTLLGNGLFLRGFAADDLRVDTLQRQFLGADLGFGLFKSDAIIAIIKRHQRVTRLDFLVLDHVHLGDVTRNLRRYDGDITFDIGVIRRHHEAAVDPPVVTIPAGAGENGKGEDRQKRRTLLGLRRCNGLGRLLRRGLGRLCGRGLGLGRDIRLFRIVDGANRAILLGRHENVP